MYTNLFSVNNLSKESLGGKEMRRKVMMSTLILFVLLSSVVLAQGYYKKIEVLYNSIKIQVDEKTIQSDAEPFIFGNRVFVPIRTVAKGINCDVEWDNKTKTVLVKKYIDFPECDYLAGELFVYGMITEIDYDNRKIEIEQHFDDNSIEVTPLLELNEDAVILFQRNDKKMNIEFSDLKCGDVIGLILDRNKKVRGMIITD